MQAAAKRVPGLRRNEAFGTLETPAMGGDVTSVKCKGQWRHLGLSVDDTGGLQLAVDEIAAEDAETQEEWIEPIA